MAVCPMSDIACEATRLEALPASSRRPGIAAESRKSDDFLIVARTDARTALGVDGRFSASRSMRRAAADLLFVESPESEEEMRRIGEIEEVWAFDRAQTDCGEASLTRKMTSATNVRTN